MKFFGHMCQNLVSIEGVAEEVGYTDSLGSNNAVFGNRIRTRASNKLENKLQDIDWTILRRAHTDHFEALATKLLYV